MEPKLSPRFDAVAAGERGGFGRAVAVDELELRQKVQGLADMRHRQGFTAGQNLFDGCQHGRGGRQ